MAQVDVTANASAMRNICQNCGQRIKTMCFKGTGLCSVSCQKAVATTITTKDHI